MACYDGNYPVPYDPVLDKHIIERRKRQAQTLGEAVEKDSEQIDAARFKLRVFPAAGEAGFPIASRGC